MKKKILLFILILLSQFYNTNTKNNKPIESLCYDEINYEGIIKQVINNVNEFNGNSINISINSTNNYTFQGYNDTIYFTFTSSERQYIDLNYTGPNASLTIYNSHYFNNKDYLVHYDNILNNLDIIYLDSNQNYVFEFINKSTTINTMTLHPIKLNSSLENHEKYILNIEYDDESSIGYHHKVEYFDLSLSTCINTTSYINSSYGQTSYLDLVDPNYSSNYTNDARRLIENTASSQYSAIAYQEARGTYIREGYIDREAKTGTATFVDNTTVVGCAHMIYLTKENNGILETGICTDNKYYPGANSYYDSINWYTDFGEYTAYRTYVPISFILFGGNGNNYDWSISLTTNTIQGTKIHSYMGLYKFSTTSSNYPYAQSTGYPTVNGRLGNYAVSMWTSFPLENSIDASSSNNGLLYSEEIVTSGGNSGGPLYVYNTSIVNGQVIKIANLIGICSSKLATSTTFYESRFVRMRPIIINIYREVIK